MAFTPFAWHVRAPASDSSRSPQQPDAKQEPELGRGGRRGPGNLVTGVWGAEPTAVDSRDWGWKSYVSASYKPPFFNKAKEPVFSGK